MMKKLLSLLLALILCLSLAACGGDDGGSDDSGEPPVTSGDTGSEDTGDAEDAGDVGGEEEAGAPEESAPVEVTGTVYTDYELLGQVTDVYHAFSPEDLAGTTWNYSGGFTNGQDLTGEEAAEVLEMYGGKFQIVFQDEENAEIVQGGGNMPGVYKVLDDGITLNFSFELQGETYTYGALFTSTSGDDGADSAEAVLIMVADAEPTTAFYMVPEA